MVEENLNNKDIGGDKVEPAKLYPERYVHDTNKQSERTKSGTDKKFSYSYNFNESSGIGQLDTYLDNKETIVDGVKTTTASIKYACVDIAVKETDPGFKMSHYFDVDKYDINYKEHNKLSVKQEAEKAIDYLLENPTKHLVIKGHTSLTGSDEHNINLAKDRVKSYNDAFLEELDKYPELKSRIHIQQEIYGESKPAINTQKETWQNRRVEIHGFDPNSTAKIERTAFNLHLDNADLNNISNNNGTVTIDGRMGSDLGEKFKYGLKAPVPAEMVALSVPNVSLNKPLNINFTGEYKLIIEDPNAKIDYKMNGKNGVEVFVDGKKFADLNYNLANGKELTPEMVHISTKKIENGEAVLTEYKKDYLKEALAKADIDKSGSISKQEYKDALEAAKLRTGTITRDGVEYTDKKYAMATYDNNKDNKFDITNYSEVAPYRQNVINVTGGGFNDKFNTAVSGIDNIKEQLTKDKALIDALKGWELKTIPENGLTFAEISAGNKSNSTAISDKKAFENSVVSNNPTIK